ncbi:hypothetical protein LTR78_007175 [Recurvomyces mirabilis]|uniref:Uncharacterized protein n=1 Tax=Recurvomyces mirabilis TaxID=574656 RepID=A0AAE0WJW4_9PEZI|nr:hypothetical protein LTR78_007175 [Recurvomyces mirabilis]KAK5150853.1 hypothetical protein LTS14_009656 [Recurvomyces mirabilis]
MSDIIEAANDKTARRRLHITPFNSALLERFIPASLQPLASDISFHNVETFPDKGFGYVELPAIEAEKLKKKLNGMTLKGSKVRIEDAKPEKKKRKTDVEEDEDDRKARKRVRKGKRKPEEGVLSGHDLESGRHVKRGWTEDGADTKSKKKKSSKEERSKATKKDAKDKKMLFKTSIPPNAMPVKDKSKKEGKEKKEKSERKAKVKTVVQEGKKSSKLVGVADKGRDGKLHYVDDQGWVDESGGVVEEARRSSRPRREKKSTKAAPLPVQDVMAVRGDNNSESTGDLDASSSEEPSSSDGEEENTEAEAPEAVAEAEAGAKSDPAAEPNDISGSQDVEDDPRTPRTSSPAQPQQAINGFTGEAKEVHPLEALFKRPATRPESASKPKPSPIDTSFSFFNSGADENMDEDDEVGTTHPPQTPHTQRDMEWRSVRSAAPTPDTAAIGKTFNFSIPDDEDDEDDEDAAATMGDVIMAEDEAGEGAPSHVGAQGGEMGESAFRKWFYENRGDLNRGWKKRRRDEKKQKRQRENRRLSRRVA